MKRDLMKSTIIFHHEGLGSVALPELEGRGAFTGGLTGGIDILNLYPFQSTKRKGGLFSHRYWTSGAL